MEYEKIIDISLEIFPGMITYPNDPEVEMKILGEGSSVLSQMTIGTHTGTHVDSHAHIRGKGGVKEIPLETFIGKCKVLDLSDVKEGITREDLEEKNIEKGDRVLVRTQNSIRGFNKFHEDFIYLENSGAEFLKEKEILLFGIDYLSVKKKGDHNRNAHHIFLENNIPILEGIDLGKVIAGDYDLIFLPLKLGGDIRDGAPGRAVLLV